MDKKDKKEYLIKNVYCFSNLLIFDINKNKFFIKNENDINKSLTNNLISKYQLKHIKDNHYQLKLKNFIFSKYN